MTEQNPHVTWDADDTGADPRHVGRPGVGRAPAGALPVPDVRGRSVLLRAWQDADLLRVEQACRDARTRHWLAGLPEDYDRDDAAAYLQHSRRQVEHASGWFVAVADPHTDDLLGAMAVMGLATGDLTSAEIGYWTHPDARGRGVMTEALALTVRHCLAPRARGGLGLRRLALQVAAGNTASMRVAHQNHFVRTGTDRQAEPLGDGTYADLLRFDLLSSDRPAT